MIVLNRLLPLAMIAALAGCAGQVTAPTQPTPASILAVNTALAPLQPLGAVTVWSDGDYAVRSACHAYLNEAATQNAKLNLVGAGIGILSGGLSVINPLAGVAGTLAQAFLSAYNASGIVPSPGAALIVERQLDAYEAGIAASPPTDPALAMSETDDLWYICSPGGIEEATMSALGGATVGLAGSPAASLSARALAIPALSTRPVITIYAR